MVEITGRIKEIQLRIKAIQNRFVSNINNKNNKVSFSDRIADIQEEVYKNNFSNSSMTINLKKYDGIIKKVAKKYSVSESLIKSIIKQESNFDNNAVSSKGAKGLMQLMPSTASLLGVKNVFNPEENITGGVKYLKMMLNKFDGDIVKALAAYNAGPKAVEKYNGVPDFSETKNYVNNILKNLGSY